ncbi:MAG: arsenite methyltransferase [Fimbriimonadales bacterium]
MSNEKLIEREDVREHVRKHYGEAALKVLSNQKASCCGTDAKAGDTCCATAEDQITAGLYSAVEAEQIPEAALLASLGCGNPTALAQLHEGEIVLDLGSGGGIDVLLSARRVGPTGFAYGLDMTVEMLTLAEMNRAESGAENVKFLKGHIEEIPLPDNTVDVIISNCVINLSADKDQVLREAFRVLKPGGRFAVSDVVVEGDLPDAIRRDMELYVGCVSGALEVNEYIGKLHAAGFVEASIEPTRRYRFSEIEGSWAPKGVVAMTEEEKKRLDGKIMGAFIRAFKPSSTAFQAVSSSGFQPKRQGQDGPATHRLEGDATVHTELQGQDGPDTHRLEGDAT